MRILIYNWKDAVSCTLKELGLKRVFGYFSGYDVVDEKLFFLSVLKYGIEFKKDKYSNEV